MTGAAKSDDATTIAALKDLLATFHVIAQREHTRARVNELLAKGGTAEDVVASLKADPPVIRPKF